MGSVAAIVNHRANRTQNSTSIGFNNDWSVLGHLHLHCKVCLSSDSDDLRLG